MKMLLGYGLCHTLVIDKDSKFLSVFKKTMSLLQINVHTASGGNHDALLTERIFPYLNKAMRIISNSLGTNRSSTQAIGLTMYAYNSAPVTGTDIVRSLPVTGREFHYPIEYAASKHTNITFDVDTIQNFAIEQERMLSCSREVFCVLVQETRA